MAETFCKAFGCKHRRCSQKLTISHRFWKLIVEESLQKHCCTVCWARDHALCPPWFDAQLHGGRCESRKNPRRQQEAQICRAVQQPTATDIDIEAQVPQHTPKTIHPAAGSSSSTAGTSTQPTMYTVGPGEEDFEMVQAPIITEGNIHVKSSS